MSGFPSFPDGNFRRLAERISVYHRVTSHFKGCEKTKRMECFQQTIVLSLYELKTYVLHDGGSLHLMFSTQFHQPLFGPDPNHQVGAGDNSTVSSLPMPTCAKYRFLDCNQGNPRWGCFDILFLLQIPTSDYYRFIDFFKVHILVTAKVFPYPCLYLDSQPNSAHSRVYCGICT